MKRSSSPASKEAAKSFLGMTGYLPEFISRYASLTAFPQEMTIETKFKWGEEENEAFEKRKSSVTRKSPMAYFDPAKPTAYTSRQIVACDQAIAVLRPQLRSGMIRQKKML